MADGDLSLDHMKKFVAMVTQYPILNNKSNTPDARKQRTDAIMSIKDRFQEELNYDVSEAQVWKKLQNMKSRVKKKGELRALGRIVNLKDWEAELLEFMERDPTVHFLDVKGTQENGQIKTEVLVSECDTISFSEDSESITDNQMAFEDCGQALTIVKPEILMDKSERKSRLQETEETRDLSTEELKRLVLLEQLKYFRKKQKLTDIKIRRELQKERDEAAPGEWSN
ncbi:uncharacterized protein LOC128985925 [Macrosteles quadrilineatus]|uniref:uncharacterized protein LOC128985925 n=1 Tax=Macrosteles quadrilineatus TaxID=74068 RepID=UPI0023E0F193|nr:uncharacterized protein LOC128985925 [Macrosteles quadrilineatus]